MHLTRIPLPDGRAHFRVAEPCPGCPAMIDVQFRTDTANEPLVWQVEAPEDDVHSLTVLSAQGDDLARHDHLDPTKPVATAGPEPDLCPNCGQGLPE